MAISRIEPIAVRPVAVAEIRRHGEALSPLAKEGVYRWLLVPAGKTAEVVLLVDGKEMSRDAVVASPKAGRNFEVHVRVKAFDSAQTETYRSVVAEIE